MVSKLGFPFTLRYPVIGMVESYEEARMAFRLLSLFVFICLYCISLPEGGGVVADWHLLSVLHGKD
jgi:hypothetical protein